MPTIESLVACPSETRSQVEPHRRPALPNVAPPGTGVRPPGFWQPVPANGYAETHVSKDRDPRIEGFSSGIQVIAPGCHIREHRHGAAQELLFFFEGTGKVLVDGEEPCGRRLDFLLQEMNREVNTFGSKADGLGVSKLIINAKAELEKMREQVQNVE